MNMKAFKTGFSLIFYKKTWVVALFTMILIPLVFPYMTPYEYNLGILEPARAQAAWGCALFLSALWGLHLSAKLGEYFQRTHLADYFYSMGMSKLSLLFQTFLVSAIWITSLVLIAVCICLFFCSPTHPIEAMMWRSSTYQFGALLLLIFLPLSLLATALASRFSALISYVLTVGLTVYGFYGVGYLEQFLSKQPMPLLDAVWHISPHYHVGDLTTRFIFKMGALPQQSFVTTTLYLLAVGLLLAGLGMLLFRGKKTKSLASWLNRSKGAVALVLLGICTLSFTSIEKTLTPNPLGVFGSEYGRTIALGMQSPIDLVWHEGTTHAHEDEEGVICDENGAHLHVVETKKELPKNLKGLIAQLEDGKKKRTNPYADPRMIRKYARGITERKIRFAWKMDPTNYDNYQNYHFFLTVTGVTERKRNYPKTIEIAKETLKSARRKIFDPKAMLTAAAAAQNVVDTSVTYQEEKKGYSHYKPWFDLADNFLQRSQSLNELIVQNNAASEEYLERYNESFNLLQAIQNGLIAKTQRNSTLQ